MDHEQQSQDATNSHETGLSQQLSQANKLYQTSVELIYGKRKSVDKAIKCVQRAIVLDDPNYKHWQLLGEAYYQRGSLNPAINCLRKSLDRAEQQLTKPDIDDDERTRVQADCTYSKLRMSDIRLSVLHLDEAIQGYSDIIHGDANNVAALLGLAKARLQLARSCFSNGLVKSGHEHCMASLQFALRSTCLSPHLCYTWKLASDCCLIQVLFGKRGPFSSTIDVPNYPGAKQGVLVVNQVTCVELAQQFLCKALAVEQFKDSACLWHNLGISLYLKFKLIESDHHRASGETRSLLKKSLKCLFKALEQDRTSSQVRNSIALVAFHLNFLNTSQSFLIKSIQTNMSTSEMQFSNLGYIYLQTDEIRLANVAFKRSQAEEPLYSRSWLGNALTSDPDNMTFLRHCHKLENSYESQLMYATKVAGLRHTGSSDKDLINALDCMRRIINYNDTSLISQNTLGLLLERCGFIEEAMKCFEMALKISPTDARIIFNKLRLMKPTESDGLHEDMDVQFIRSAERLAEADSQECKLNLIYHLFRNGKFRSIGSRVSKVMEKMPPKDGREKIGAQILLAMADKMEGRDFRSWLLKNINHPHGTVCVESVISLFCLMLFGSLAADQNLVDRAGNELKNCLISYLSTKTTQFADLFYSLEGYWTRLSLFSSIFINRSNLIRPMVALFPMIPDLWLFLGLSLMSRESTLSRAHYCITRASLIGSANANLTSVCDMLLAILSNMQVDNKVARAKQIDLLTRGAHLCRAIYKCPNSSILWDCLIKESKSCDKNRSVENVKLFQCAVDHTMRTMILR